MKKIKYFFCNISWMKNYRGETKNDKPLEAGKGGKCEKKHEVCNFYPDENGWLLSYVQPQGRNPKSASDKKDPPTWKNMNIGRIVNATQENKEYEENVFVVWTAPKHDENGKRQKGDGNVVVGWYKNATVYRNTQKSDFISNLHEKNDINIYRIKARKENACLLPIKERIGLPEKMGEQIRRGIWYDENKEGEEFVTNEIWEKVTEKATKQKRNTINPERNKKVEEAAVDAVTRHYKNLGYEVQSVEAENRGWDVECFKDGIRELKVEVKGLSGATPHVHLTQNEYNNAFNKKIDDYRLAIVTRIDIDSPNHNLEENILICYYDKKWKVEKKPRKIVEEILSAEIRIVEPPEDK